MKHTRTRTNQVAKRMLSIMMAMVMIVLAMPFVNLRAGAESIPPDAVKFNGHYYLAFDESKTWTEAEAFCEELGGHLATVTSLEENNFIFELTSQQQERHYWLGGSDQDTEGVWVWVTGEPWGFTDWARYDQWTQPDNSYDTEHFLEFENLRKIEFEGGWNDLEVSGGTYNSPNSLGFICEWENIYNLGEETYRFENYSDSHSRGHCFGMSVTSSGYYLDVLSKTIIGGSNDSMLYSFDDTATVRAPICHYHQIQGPGAERNSMVAGGSIDLTGTTNTIADWNSCVNYVSDHQFDDRGTLTVGMWYQNGGGHSVNFLYYDEVDGQQRIYVYDNNFPEDKTYYYLGENGLIYQAPLQTLKDGIIGLDLMNVSNYFALAEEFQMNQYVYANRNEIAVEGAKMYYMKCGPELSNYVMFELPDDLTQVKITPLVDGATFTYMGETYAFGKIDEDTCGILTLAEDETETGSFAVENAPEEQPEGPTNPTTPTNPTQPTEPTTQPQQQSGACAYCGGSHTGLFGWLIGFFHSILAMFGLKK